MEVHYFFVGDDAFAFPSTFMFLDVRYILVPELPKTREALLQMAGRGGRGARKDSFLVCPTKGYLEAGGCFRTTMGTHFEGIFVTSDRG